jgi:hypothetical protein
MDGEWNSDWAEMTYRAIGRFMFEFSQIEYSIKHHLALESGRSLEDLEHWPVAEVVKTAKADFEKSRKGNEESTRIQSFLNRLVEINHIRHRVAHGLWVPSLDGGTVFFVPRSRRNTPMSVDDETYTEQAVALDQLADEIASLRNEFEQQLFYWRPIIGQEKVSSYTIISPPDD